MRMVGGAVARRAMWSAVSQGVSSLSNFLLTVTALAAAGRTEFAVFSICITTYLLVSQLARSISGVPLLVLYSDGDGDRAEHRAAVGVPLLVGMLSGTLLLLAALFTAREAGQLVIVGVALPPLLLQDTLRHLAFARSRPDLAAGNDLLRLGLQILLSVGAWAAGAATVPVLLGAWAASGAAAAVAATRSLQVVPSGARAFGWLRSHRALCEKLAYEFVLTSGSFYLLLYGLAAIAGMDELGRLRAAQTLIGPVIVVLLAGSSLGIPEGVRVREEIARLRRLSLLLSGGLAAVAILWGLSVYLSLPLVGPAVFAESWESARPLLPLLTIFAAAVGVSTGATSALRALGESSWLLRARGATGAVTVLAGIPLSGAGGAPGALAALALSEAVFALAAWIRLQRTERPTPGDEEEPPPFVPE